MKISTAGAPHMRVKWLIAMSVAIASFTAGLLPLAEAQTAPQTKDEKPVAVIGGGAGNGAGNEAIYERDYLPQIQSQIYKIRTQEYELRLKAIEAEVNRKLMAAEAKKRGVSEEELLKQEADSKVPEPSSQEIEQRLVMQMFRGGVPTSKEQIASDLKQGKIQQLRDAYFAALREKAGVKIFLAPPRHTVAFDAARVRGNPDAPITIVEFSDFQCPFCYQAYNTVKAVLKKYEGKVKLAYRDMPLMGEEADPNGTAAASRCAGEQGKFWEYHDLLFENQDDIGPRVFREYAEDLKIDVPRFESCVASGKFRAVIADDFREGLRLGITGTPYFFINGIPINGALPQPVFEEIIDNELAALGR
jgi:protein-disulfide isomerase